MFWKFHLASSGLDTLLAKEDVTLKEVLDEEDILQECKTQNSKLIEFLVKDDVLSELLDLAINEPSEDSDLKTQFKYPNLACEVVCSDIDQVIEKIAGDKSLLDKLWRFLDHPPPLNPLIASFFAKIIATILAKKGSEVFEYMKEQDTVNRLLSHLDVSAMMEVFVKLMSVVDSQEMKAKMETWLQEQELVQKLIKRLSPEYPHEMHCNSSNLLSELVRMGRESTSQFGEAEEPSKLFNTIEREEVLSDLLETILSDRESSNADSSLVNGMDVILSLVEYKRPNPEGLEELFTPVSAEKIAQGVQSALKAVTPRLKDFHLLLMDPPPQAPMLTTIGTLDPPLGKVRLHVAWLISAIVTTNTPYVNSELTELGTINVLLDLFFKYQWNNFLHSYVEHCIGSILSNEVINEDGSGKNPLLTHLLCDCCLITKILKAWEENESQQSNPGGQRRGYMGHLTSIANSLKHNLETGPNAELLQSLFNDLPEDDRTSWKDLVEGALSDINTRNTSQMPLSALIGHSSSEDDDDGAFKSVSILQYENSLQQAFSNYQVQQMSNEFIESFGHNEDELNEMSKHDNPFDEIGNVDFTINANDETPDAQLFEAVCNEKIHRFDDNGSDDERPPLTKWRVVDIDVWEEKELKFSPRGNMKRRPAESNSDESDNSSEDSSSSGDEESVFTDVGKRNDPFTTKKSDDSIKASKECEENMDIDISETEWTANFDSEGVAMDTLDAAAVGWVDSSATSVVEVTDEAGFADFTDITKFSCDADENTEKQSTGPESPVAMDEDSNDSVKAEVPTKDETKPEMKDIPTEDDRMDEDLPESERSYVKTEVSKESETKEESESHSGNKEEKDSKLIEKEVDKVNDNNKKQNETEDKSISKKEENVKVDVFESGDDPMLVTSQVVGGFVVIDAAGSEEKGNEKEIKESTQIEVNTSSPQKQSLSPSHGAVSVVTVSSRQVININSDGKVESPRSPKTSRSPRSPKKSQSPTNIKSPRSPQSPQSPPRAKSPANDKPGSPREESISESIGSHMESKESKTESDALQRTEIIVDVPKANGPVVLAEEMKDTINHQIESDKQTSSQSSSDVKS